MNSNSSTYLSYSNPIENTSLLPSSEFMFTFEDSPQLLFNTNNSIEVFKKIITVYSIDSKKYTLKKPLAILVYSEDSEFKAVLPSLELYSFADSESEAIDELLCDFVDLCDTVLNHNFNDLGMYPKVWSRIIHSIINIK